MTPAFFGYGSLVNLATHEYPNPRKARLHGWQRVWQHPKTREVAFLSVRPAECAIDGLICDVPNGNWVELDEREHAYNRHDISNQLGGQTAVYQADPSKCAPPSIVRPILLSYLDVVVQGCLTHYGEDGVKEFFASTAGWGPIKNDRQDPLYPRHQELTKAEHALVDQHLAMTMK